MVDQTPYLQMMRYNNEQPNFRIFLKYHSFFFVFVSLLFFMINSFLFKEVSKVKCYFKNNLILYLCCFFNASFICKSETNFHSSKFKLNAKQSEDCLLFFLRRLVMVKVSFNNYYREINFFRY